MAPRGRSRWRSRSVIARSTSRCCRTRGTPPTARRPRQPCVRLRSSSIGCCVSITKAIWPRKIEQFRVPPLRAAEIADLRLNNGKSRIDFQTDPSKYRHWKLSVDGEIATLLMDVDEKGTLFEGYELKLNSYDLGVDIELADAIERLRFEHPQVKVVLLRSGKPRVFCAGANIRMLAGATHAHKVNFCKFTNETRNGIEDASEASGLP